MIHVARQVGKSTGCATLRYGLRSQLFESRRYPMRRIQALVLLIAVLSSPILAFAEAIHQPTACCCCGSLCPMHKPGSVRQGPHGEPLCGGATGRNEQCNMAVCNRQSLHDGILQPAPKGVLPLIRVLLLPENVPISAVSEYRREPSRFILPLEQPPRF